jgi:hypothetical protein
MPAMRTAAASLAIGLIIGGIASAEVTVTGSVQPYAGSGMALTHSRAAISKNTADVDLPELSVSAEPTGFRNRPMSKSNWDPRICIGC